MEKILLNNTEFKSLENKLLNETFNKKTQVKKLVMMLNY
jgi:hypothetical protein